MRPEQKVHFTSEVKGSRRKAGPTHFHYSGESLPVEGETFRPPWALLWAGPFWTGTSGETFGETFGGSQKFRTSAFLRNLLGHTFGPAALQRVEEGSPEEKKPESGETFGKHVATSFVPSAVPTQRPSGRVHSFCSFFSSSALLLSFSSSLPLFFSSSLLVFVSDSSLKCSEPAY